VAEVERQLGTVQTGIEMVEYIAAEEYVLFGEGDDLQTPEAYLGDRWRS